MIRPTVPTMPLTDDQAFFFAEMGYSYDPLTETDAQGLTRCSMAAAAAEAALLRAIKVADVGIEWLYDYVGAREATAEREKYKTVEYAYIWHQPADAERRDQLAVVAGVIDADTKYRRVVRAQLAEECLDALLRIIHEAA